MLDLAIDARMAYSSGIGTCIRELVPFFNTPPFRVILLVHQLNQEWCKGLEQILFPQPIYSVGEQLSFYRKIPSCDVFWSPHYNIPMGPIKAKKRVVTIHDACHLALPQYLSPIQRIYAKIVMKQALYRSNAVVTDSLFSKTELHQYLGHPKRPITLIPPAVNKHLFQPTKDRIKLEQVKRKYHLPDLFFLFVGNFKPNKNLAGLLQAFQEANLPNWGLVIAGKDSHNIQGNQILALGTIPDEDLRILYSLATVFVFPSFYEGFGLPPLEAMSCGCATIVSHAASLPEVCGEASLYFDPSNPIEIASAMTKVASDISFRKQLVQLGFKRILNFNWMESAKSYLRLFETVGKE